MISHVAAHVVHTWNFGAAIVGAILAIIATVGTIIGDLYDMAQEDGCSEVAIVEVMDYHCEAGEIE